jgi:hypothetical protein
MNFQQFTESVCAAFDRGDFTGGVNMDIQMFTEVLYQAYEINDEKTVVLFAQMFPELYREYAIAEGLIDEDDEV